MTAHLHLDVFSTLDGFRCPTAQLGAALWASKGPYSSTTSSPCTRGHRWFRGQHYLAPRRCWLGIEESRAGDPWSPE